MFVRVFLVSVILLLISQVSVKASTDSTQCGEGTARCCQEESSELGNVNDEECQSYSDPCPSGYLASCCYTVPNVYYYYCNQSGSS